MHETYFRRGKIPDYPSIQVVDQREIVHSGQVMRELEDSRWVIFLLL